MQNKPYRLQIIAALSILLSLSGCFWTDQPTDKQIQTQAKTFFDLQNPSLFEATSIIKRNGYKQNDTHYVAEITLKARAKQSLADYTYAITHDPSLTPLEKVTNSVRASLMKLAVNDFKENDTFEYQKNYLFIKTDEGWLLRQDLTDEQNL